MNNWRLPSKLFWISVAVGFANVIYSAAKLITSSVSLSVWLGFYLGMAGTALMVGSRYSVRWSAVYKPPGARLDRIARFVFSKRSYREVFGPCIADLQYEYFEALQARSRWKARWEILRGYCAFTAAVVAHLPLSLIRMVVTLWKAIG